MEAIIFSFLKSKYHDLGVWYADFGGVGCVFLLPHHLNYSSAFPILSSAGKYYVTCDGFFVDMKKDLNW